jgi:DNA-binding FadR family transcriptional regulator
VLKSLMIVVIKNKGRQNMNSKKILKSEHEIFNLLLIKLYTRQFKPGETLPSLKVFARQLGVDQASLRITLKQLEVMNLLDIRRSDGAYVKDFKETGRLDFLTNLFSIEGIQEDESILDSFLVEEVLSFWVAIYPEILFMASKRFSPLDMKQFIEILDSQTKNIDNIEKLVELDLLAQELVGKQANNLLVSLFLNSVKPLIVKMTNVFYRNLTKESRLHFIKIKKKGALRFLNGTLDVSISTENYRKEMEKCRKEILKSITEDMFDS